MRVSQWNVLFTAALICSCGSWLCAGPVNDMVGEVSQASYTHYLTDPDLLYTQQGDMRDHNFEPGTEQFQAARDNIQRTFSGFGFNVAVESGWSNIVATKPGVTHPNDIYIIGAHYDSVWCAGADDNASGVAGVLEAARVISQHQFDSTVVVIAFDGEEAGYSLNGSRQYVAAAKARGDNIKGMLNLDMIGASRGNPEEAEVWSYDASEPMRDKLVRALADYGGLTGIKVTNNYEISDHVPFENAGYLAGMFIERDPFASTTRHTENDYVTYPGNIDFGYATNIVRASVGYLGENAGVVPEPGVFTISMLGTTVCLMLRRRSTRAPDGVPSRARRGAMLPTRLA